MSSPSHDAIFSAAGRLFGERGYRAVTVRDIAADAGVSAALVMKLFVSKEKLYAAVRPDESQLAELEVPTPPGKISADATWPPPPGSSGTPHRISGSPPPWRP